jgi:S1-C subfamily serine protease
MTKLAIVLASFVAAGCGGGAPAPQVAPRPTSATAPGKATPGVAAVPANALRRSVVDAVLAAGPGAFLQSVAVDDRAVFLAGKFHGFRIAALRGDAWTGVDLRPGDVVTRVNGFPIEHPEQAAEAFYSLRVASELRVEYERDGEPRELRYAIVEDGAPAPAPPTRRN